MLKVYCRGSCGSSKRAKAWFVEHGIEFESYLISQLPREELLRILPLTEAGMASIVKSVAKANSETKAGLLKLARMQFNDGVNFLNVHPQLLQTPIIIKGNQLMIGFNSEEIRQFIPKAYRKIQKENKGLL